MYPVFAKEPVKDMQQLGIQDCKQKMAYRLTKENGWCKLLNIQQNEVWQICHVDMSSLRGQVSFFMF